MFDLDLARERGESAAFLEHDEGPTGACRCCALVLAEQLRFLAREEGAARLSSGRRAAAISWRARAPS